MALRVFIFDLLNRGISLWSPSASLVSSHHQPSRVGWVLSLLTSQKKVSLLLSTTSKPISVGEIYPHIFTSMDLSSSLGSWDIVIAVWQIKNWGSKRLKICRPLYGFCLYQLLCGNKTCKVSEYVGGEGKEAGNLSWNPNLPCFSRSTLLSTLAH